MPFFQKTSDKWYDTIPWGIFLMMIPGVGIVMFFIKYKKLTVKERFFFLFGVIVYTICAVAGILRFFS
jgi:hypothetical protein